MREVVVTGIGLVTPLGVGQEVLVKLENGIDVLIDIDWQGTRQITKAVKGNLIKIFLLPPSINELKKRLSKRNSDSIKEINFRMSKALKEIKHYDEYDYVLVNNNLDDTFKQIVKILEAERLKLSKQLYLSNFVKKLHLI